MPGLTTEWRSRSRCTPRGLAGFVLFRNRADEVLLIERRAQSTDPGRWVLPGGNASPEEQLPVACRRLVLAQTGLELLPERLLVVCQVAAGRTGPEGTGHIFDGGLCFGDVALTDGLTSYRWVAPHALGQFLAPHAEWSVRCALDAAHGAPVRYLCGRRAPGNSWLSEPSVPHSGRGPLADLASSAVAAVRSLRRSL